MKALVVLLLLAASLCISAEEPKIGSPLPPEAEEAKCNGNGMLVLADSAQLYPAFIVIDNNTQYTIGIDERSFIAYITPTEPTTFKSPEGIFVGSTLPTVQAIAKQPPIKRLGWGYFLPLPSGWNAAFIVGTGNPTPDKLPADAKVSFLFKSEWAK